MARAVVNDASESFIGTCLREFFRLKLRYISSSTKALASGSEWNNLTQS